MPVYLTLQPIRRAAGYVAIAPGGLLPHLFTLTTNGGGCFLSRYSTLANGFPLVNMALCVARTFLSPSQDSQRQGRETAFLSAKLDFFHEKPQLYFKKITFYLVYQPNSLPFLCFSPPKTALTRIIKRCKNRDDGA